MVNVFTMMTQIKRECEFKFLCGLIDHTDIKQEWFLLYKDWIKNEYSPFMNSTLIQTWVKRVNNEILFYEYIQNYPTSIKLECERVARGFW